MKTPIQFYIELGFYSVKYKMTVHYNNKSSFQLTLERCYNIAN